MPKGACHSTEPKTLMASLLIAALGLGCVACGSSGVESRAEVMRRLEGHRQRCPERAPRRRDNEHSRAERMLVPPGARSALICRYRGWRTAGSPPAVEAEVLQAGSMRFQRLVHAFEQLEPVRRGPVACPAGTPLRYLVAFHYRNQSDNYIRVDFTGCGLVTNDALKTLFYPSERLRGILG
jgi:hypothetical protein